MVVNCEQVWQEISNYLENDVDAALRSAMDEHFRECERCSSVLQGTKNVIQLYGDERLFQAPFGYSWRLRGKIAANLPPRNGTALGWIVAVAATALFMGSLAIAGYAARAQPALLSEHARESSRIPKELIVLVAPHTKVFHVAGCTFIHDQNLGLHSMTAAEAEDAGYVPCVRCLGKYLVQAAEEFFARHKRIAA